MTPDTATRFGWRRFQYMKLSSGRSPMWFEEAPEQRLSRLRAQETLTTDARTLATACPFCLNMMSDGMASTPGGENVKVLDIAELVVEAQEVVHR